MLRRVMCCFSKGSACDGAVKVNNNSDDKPSTADFKLEQQHPKEKKSTVGNTGPKAGKGSVQSPVLVELFTSQGCSSCPPADLLISQLGQGRSPDVALEVPMVVLGFHVDYWDYLGWKDPFASSTWTLRQRNYGQALQQDSIYTPEVVVQGRSHCIASGLEPILALIHAAPRFAAPEINASFKMMSSPLSLEVTLEVALKFKVEGYTLDIMVAVLENGLVTNIEKGENKGRIVTNDFVVRVLAKAATLQDWPAKRTVRSQATLPLWEGFSKSKSGVVLFLQNPSSMEVYGAQMLELPDDLS